MQIIIIVLRIITFIGAFTGPIIDKYTKDDSNHDILMSKYKKSLIFYISITSGLIIVNSII